MAGPTRISRAAERLKIGAQAFIAHNPPAETWAPKPNWPAPKTHPWLDWLPGRTQTSIPQPRALQTSNWGQSDIHGWQDNQVGLPPAGSDVTPLVPVPPVASPSPAQPSKSARIIALLMALLLAASAALWIVPPPWWGGHEQFTAHIIRVYDGDSPTMQRSDGTHQLLRMAEIDAPEKRQVGGIESRDHLCDLILDRDVEVTVMSIDMHRRPVVHLRIGGRDVSRQMVADGQAWTYWHYLDDPIVPLLEWRARLYDLGLWARPRDERQPPWDYRRAHRKAAAEKRRQNGR